jgi:hypothetical protein
MTSDEGDDSNTDNIREDDDNDDYDTQGIDNIAIEDTTNCYRTKLNDFGELI